MPTTDTSWLFALLAPADPHHAQALREAGDGQPLIAPAVIAAELLQLIQWRARQRQGLARARRIACGALEDLEHIPTFRIETGYDVADAQRVFLANTRLSYADAVAVSVARRMGTGLLSFDRDQKTALARHTA